MNTTQMHDTSSFLGHLAGRSDARYDLPTPLLDEDGGGDCYPSDENETGP